MEQFAKSVKWEHSSDGGQQVDLRITCKPDGTYLLRDIKGGQETVLADETSFQSTLTSLAQDGMEKARG